MIYFVVLYFGVTMPYYLIYMYLFYNALNIIILLMAISMLEIFCRSLTVQQQDVYIICVVFYISFTVRYDVPEIRRT